MKEHRRVVGNFQAVQYMYKLSPKTKRQMGTGGKNDQKMDRNSLNSRTLIKQKILEFDKFPKEEI